MKCLRCGQEIEADAPEGVEICGSCADDCREEEKAAQTEIEANEGRGTIMYLRPFSPPKNRFSERGIW